MISMSVNMSFTPESEFLELYFEGKLDVTMTREVFEIIPIIYKLEDAVQTCVLDLTQVDQVCDSGMALLYTLNGALRRAGATVVVLGEHPDVRKNLSLTERSAVSRAPHEKLSRAPQPGRVSFVRVH
jgi:anti-anti-sigma factor